MDIKAAIIAPLKNPLKNPLTSLYAPGMLSFGCGETPLGKPNSFGPQPTPGHPAGTPLYKAIQKSYARARGGGSWAKWRSR